jgi:transposase
MHTNIKGGTTMKDISVLGIDLAKAVFQLHGNDEKGKCILRKKLRRNQLLHSIEAMNKCVIAMEACSSAHYWGRKFVAAGHEVRLIPPQFVKPFVKSNKNDTADAEAIAEAAVRPNMHFVPLKTVEQIELQSMLRVRQRLIKNRTALSNQMRGLLYEFGIVFKKGINQLRILAPDLISGKESSELTMAGRATLADLHSELLEIEEHLRVIDIRIKKDGEKNESVARIQEIPGVGILTAVAISCAAGDAKVFKNGRQFAAWLGLVPKHQGTGGKNRTLGISKRGDPYLRSLLVHGARSALLRAPLRTDQLAVWASKLKENKGWNKAAVALANKNARIIWALLTSGGTFDAGKASIPAPAAIAG